MKQKLKLAQKYLYASCYFRKEEINTIFKPQI